MRPVLVWITAAAAAGASLMNVCALLFSCGCRSWWSGAAAACNIHHAGVRHCPWCTLDPGWFWSLFTGLVLAQGGTVFLLRHRSGWLQALAATLAFLAGAAASAAVLGWRSGYWT